MAWRGIPDRRFAVYYVLAAYALPAATCRISNRTDRAGAEQLIDLFNRHAPRAASFVGANGFTGKPHREQHLRLHAL